jgi:hypothetical protein
VGRPAQHIGELARDGVEIGRAMVPVLALQKRLGVQKAQHLDLVERAVALVVAEPVGGEVEAVPDRDLVPPPELARDRPGLDVLQPVEIDLAVLLGDDGRAPVADGVERGAHDLGGVDEPLVGQHRLDHDLGAVAEGLGDDLVLDERHHLVRALLAMGERRGAENRVVRPRHHGEPFVEDLRRDLPAGREPVEPTQVIGHEVQEIGLRLAERALAFRDLLRDGGGLGIGQAVLAHVALAVHQPVAGDAAALGDPVVVEVMRAGDLHRARAEIGSGYSSVMIGIRRRCSFGPTGISQSMPTIGRVAFIRGMNRDRAVAQHRLGPRGGDGDVVALLLEDHVPVFVFLHIRIGRAARERVLEVPHVAPDIDVLDLQVRDRRLEMRVPVHQPLAAVDEALLVHVDEDLDDGVVEIAVLALGRAGGAGHGEGLARPVAGGAEALQLLADRAARLRLPRPDMGQEFLPAEIAALDLGFGELAFDDHLRGDARMVLPGCQSVSKPRIRCQRVSTSCSVLLKAWPTCRTPVTLGGGIMMENASAPGSAFAPAAKAFASSQAA